MGSLICVGNPAAISFVEIVDSSRWYRGHSVLPSWFSFEAVLVVMACRAIFLFNFLQDSQFEVTAYALFDTRNATYPNSPHWMTKSVSYTTLQDTSGVNQLPKAGLVVFATDGIYLRGWLL